VAGMAGQPTVGGTPDAVEFGSRCIFLEVFYFVHLFFENQRKINIKKFRSE
jgi:hypothetical protein